MKGRVKGFRGSLNLAVTMVAAVILATGCSGGDKSDEYVRIEGAGIGTTYRIVAHTGKENIRRIVDAADSIFNMMTMSVSIYDSTSLLSRINRGETDSVDCHIERLLEMAAEVSELSDGKYDVTVAPLTEAYGFAGGDKPKHTPNIDSLMEFVGYRKVSVADGRLVREDKRMQLDFNSIAKGYTVDLIAGAIDSMGIADYMVEVGGEIVCRGKNPLSGMWRVAVDSPVDGNMTPGENCQVILKLTDCGMATSGNYRRFYIDENGRKIAHTIDPTTGQSAVSNLLSATVIAPTSAEADALGTMCMSVGLERAKELISSLSDVSAYLIYVDEGSDREGEFRVWHSPGMRKMIAQ